MRNKTTLTLAAATIASFVAGTAYAQTTAFTLEGSAEDEVEDLNEQIEDDAERDLIFNTGEVGDYGSVAMRFVQNDDENGDDTISAGIGLTYGYFDGVNGYEANLSYVYEETNDETDTDRLTGSVDYTRSFTPNFFAYTDLTVRVDREAEGDDNQRDAFVGFGAGYRVINSSVSQWALKAGPGYRYIQEGNGTEVDEAAFSVESNYYRQLTDTVAVTNDTRIIGSDFDTTFTNDLAVNVAVTDALALRTNYLLEYTGDDIGALERDNSSLGVSVVYSFN